MTAIAADAGRHPVSAQCGMLGVARPTYYSMHFHAEGPKPPDPIERDVTAAHDASYGCYGARKIKTALSRAGITASRAPAHPRVQRLDLRARRRRLEVRLPADRSPQPRDSGAFRGAA